MTMIIVSPSLPSSYAHQRVPYSINGKDYLFAIGSLNEHASVDDKTGVDKVSGQILLIQQIPMPMEQNQ